MSPVPARRPVSRRVTLVLAAALALVAPACSKGNDTATTASSTTVAGPGGTATAGTAQGPTTLPPNVAPLKVVIQGMTIPSAPKGRASYAIVFSNPNVWYIAEGVTVDVTFKDAKGSDVGTDSLTIPAVAPKSDAAAAHTAKVDGATKFTASFRVANWRQSPGGYPAFGLSAPEFDRSSVNGTQVKLKVTNPYNVAVARAQVAVVLVNGLTVVGGDTAAAPTIPPGGTVEVTVRMGGIFSPTINSAKAFVLPATLPNPKALAGGGGGSTATPTTAKPAGTTGTTAKAAPGTTAAVRR